VSNYYHIECMTCAEQSCDLGNNVKARIKALAAEWPAIKDALSLIGRLERQNVYVDLTFLGGAAYDFPRFMQDHADHQLEVVGEDNREPLVVASAPDVHTFNPPVPTSLPDGAWVRVRGSAIVEANFCDNSRDCIACGTRIAPNFGVCLTCHDRIALRHCACGPDGPCKVHGLSRGDDAPASAIPTPTPRLDRIVEGVVLSEYPT